MKGRLKDHSTRDIGEMGIGQTILLIAAILVAASGAGVLLQTGGNLMSRGDIAGRSVERSASSKVLLENVIVFDDGPDQDIDDLYITLRLAPGSKEMDLAKANVKVEWADISADLSYTSNLAGEDATHFNCENAQAQDGGSGSSGLVSDPDLRFTLSNPVMSAGTIVQIHMDLAAIFALGAAPGDNIDVRIDTGTSSPGYISVTVPDPLESEFMIVK
jgi:archaellin